MKAIFRQLEMIQTHRMGLCLKVEPETAKLINTVGFGNGNHVIFQSIVNYIDRYIDVF